MSSSRSLSSAQARRTVENYTPPLSVLNARGNPRKSIASRNMPTPPLQQQYSYQQQQQQQQSDYQQQEYNQMYQQPTPQMFVPRNQQPLLDIQSESPQTLLPRSGKIHINNAIGLITLRLSNLEEQLKLTENNETGDFNSIVSTLVGRIEVLEEQLPKKLLDTITELQKEVEYLKQITTLLNSSSGTLETDNSQPFLVVSDA